MCDSLLDEIIKVRQEMRESKWTSEKSTNFLILSAIFSSSGSQIKGIVEFLNLLALFEPTKASLAKSVADEIITIQKAKGHLNLIDFQVTLKRILHQDIVSAFDLLVSNCKNYFGSKPEEVQFEPAVLEELDGTFDSQFSTSLSLLPQAPPPVPVATSSTTEAAANSREQIMQKVEKLNPAFAAKLQRFSE